MVLVAIDALVFWLHHHLVSAARGVCIHTGSRVRLRCEGKGVRRKGWMDRRMGKGTAQVPGSSPALPLQYLLFCSSSHSCLLPVLPRAPLPDRC